MKANVVQEEPLSKTDVSFEFDEEEDTFVGARTQTETQIEDASLHENNESQQPARIAGNAVSEWTVDWSSVAPAFDEYVAQPTAKALYSFFYTTEGGDSTLVSTASRRTTTTEGATNIEPEDARATSDRTVSGFFEDDIPEDDEYELRQTVEKFWKTYDHILMISLGSILGILMRYGASLFFTWADENSVIFRSDSPLFTNLPLNLLSCFLLGLLCSGSECLQIIHRRRQMPDEAHSLFGSQNTYLIRNPQGQEERRQVALEFYERRIRESASLLLFPAPKEEVDLVMRYDHGETQAIQPELQTSTCPPPTSTLPAGLRHRRGPHEMAPISPITQPSTRPCNFVGLNHSSQAPSPSNSTDSSDNQTLSPAASSPIKQNPPQSQKDSTTQHNMKTPPRNGSSQELTDSDEDGVVRPNKRLTPTSRSPRGLDPRIYVGVNPSTRHSNDVDSNLDSEFQSSNPNQVQSPRTEPLEISQGNEEIYNSDGTTIEESLAAAVNDATKHISKNLQYLTRLRIAEGWDVGTTATAMQSDILLGLRVGVCGAMGSFSSWNSDMVNLLRNGSIGSAFVGYALGLQLPIIAYRSGQYLAVFVFILRCKSETAKDERRGYGLRLGDGEDEFDDIQLNANVEQISRSNENQVISNSNQNHTSPSPRSEALGGNSTPSRMLNEVAAEREQPSIRAILTATAMLVLVCLLTSLHLFTSASAQQFTISLLFSPFGGLARWKITNSWNTVLPDFPLGTFTCNMLGCALSGSLGSFLAGNPGPEESIVLMSIINGFGGALSTLGSYIAEVLGLIDPILFKYDGITYACVTIIWGIFIGLVTVQSKDWADEFKNDF